MPAAPPKTGRKYRTAGAAGWGHTHLDSDPLDTPIRSAETFHATVANAAELHDVDTAQLRDQLRRELRPGQAVLLRHILHGAAALAADPLHIPRTPASVPDAEMAALMALRPAARRKWQRSDGTV